MFLTEEQAREKKCFHWDGAENCAASTCMAWRWAERKYKPLDPDQTVIRENRKGFCGLAGGVLYE